MLINFENILGALILKITGANQLLKMVSNVRKTYSQIHLFIFIKWCTLFIIFKISDIHKMRDIIVHAQWSFYALMTYTYPMAKRADNC